MIRWIAAGGALALLLYLGFKTPVYSAFARAGEPAPSEAPDYTMPDAWAARPEAPPPGAWERHWGVDAFVLTGPSNTANADGACPIGDDAVQNATLDYAEPYLAAAASADAVYAPFLRHPSAALAKPSLQLTALAKEDALNAFVNYLDADNRGRAFIIVSMPGAETAAEALATFIAADDLLLERFGGIVRIAARSDAGEPNSAEGTCSPAFAGDCVVAIEAKKAVDLGSLLLPRLSGRTPRYEFVFPGRLSTDLKERAGALSAWLDENGVKPAEPLEGFEEIAIAPVRLPGQTD